MPVETQSTRERKHVLGLRQAHEAGASVIRHYNAKNAAADSLVAAIEEDRRQGGRDQDRRFNRGGRFRKPIKRFQYHRRRYQRRPQRNVPG
jgi:hypothetical protein